MIYLAAPYTHLDPAIKEARFQAVNKVAAKLIREGQTVFSPISMTHPIAVSNKLPGDWKFWRAFDTEFLKCCVKMYVLKLDGWNQSAGVLAEIAVAKELGLEIVYLEP